MEECKIENLYNLDETIAKELLQRFEYPWEVLPNINDFSSHKKLSVFIGTDSSV